MDQNEMTEKITQELQQSIRQTIETRDLAPFQRAAVEAYRLRTAGQALASEEAIVQHVFPSDVQQTVLLSLQLLDKDKEKASVLLKGALEQILSRLSVVPNNHWHPPAEPSRWKFWKR
ncbi:MAG: hypothetical protein O2954_11470 [bacterium]|nr:hypothetical protein [bacterium]